MGASHGGEAVRTFVAIEIPDTAKESLAALSGRLRTPGVRATWVKPENMHLTLRFLDELDAGQIEALATKLENAYQKYTPFHLHIRGTGAFPNVRKPSVIWAGLEPLEGALAEVQAIAENAARDIGLPPDNKTFRAHLTLARIRDKRTAHPLMARLEQEQDFDGGEFWVQGVSLCSSQLTPKGPIYRRLREFCFDNHRSA